MRCVADKNVYAPLPRATIISIFMTYQLQNLLRDELKPGERVLWCGQPDSWRVARQRIGLFIFGLVFLGIVLFGAARANNLDVSGLKDMAPDSLLFFVLCFSPFIVIFLLLLLSPLWTVRTAKKTLYAVTSSRALIFEPNTFIGFTLRSFAPGTLNDVERTQRANGSGDLVFKKDFVRTARKSRGYTFPVGFFGIPDVRNVERILTAMRDENLRASKQGGET